MTLDAPVIEAKPTIACSMVFDGKVYVRYLHAIQLQLINVTSGSMASASAWLPLLYDTVIVALTLNRTLSSVRHKTASNIARVVLRDGILYYR